MAVEDAGTADGSDGSDASSATAEPGAVRDHPTPEPRTTPRRLAPYDGPRSPSVQATLDATTRLGEGEPFNVFTTLAHHGRALRHTVALGGAFLFAGNISDRLREIVIIRVARNTRCEYEYAQHVVIGQRSGLSLAECRTLIAPDGSAGGLGDSFTAEERDVIAMTDELCADDCVGDSTWAALASTWDERQLVELVVLAGYYRMLAGLLSSAGVELDAGLTGWQT